MHRPGDVTVWSKKGIITGLGARTMCGGSGRVGQERAIEQAERALREWTHDAQG